MRGTRVGILEARRRAVGGLFATVMDYFWREDSHGSYSNCPTAGGHRPRPPGPTCPPTRSRRHWTGRSFWPSPAAAGPGLPAPPDRPADQAAADAVTPAAFWALLPAADRDRLGLRLSQLVLKAVRPPVPEEVR